MHAELGWVLGCITTMPRLAHLPQFKEKSDKLKDIPLGLYIYPVLQSADILLYKLVQDFLRMYGMYIPNQKFDFIRISVFAIQQKSGKKSLISKMSRTFILHNINAEKLIKKHVNQDFFTIILFNLRYHYKYSYNILSISNFLIKF